MMKDRALTFKSGKKSGAITDEVIWYKSKRGSTSQAE